MTRLLRAALPLALFAGLGACDASVPDGLQPDGAADAGDATPDAAPIDDDALDPDATASDALDPDAPAPDGAPDGADEATGDVGPELPVDPPPPTGEALAESTLPDALTQALLAALEAGWEGSEAPGVALGVVVPGLGAFHGAVGFSLADPPAQALPLERYRVGSITKTFTAALVLELVDDGTLTLDDTAAAWLPALAEAVPLDPAITVRQLLSHTSGLFNFTDDWQFLSHALEPGTPEDVLAFALSHPPEFAPGQGYGYSNTNYFVLGLLIEAATGQPYHLRLRERLLAPFELRDTFLDGSETLPGGTVAGHLLGADATDLGHMSWAWAAGALASNTRDLCAWMDALLGGEVLPADLTQALSTPATLPWGAKAPYGLGLQLSHRAGRPVVGHTGSTIGFVAEVFVEPDSGACVAILMNDFFGVREPVATPVWQAVMEALP